MDKQGLFVEIEKNKEYLGPFERLNEARGEARKIGPNLRILHGILKKTKDGYDTSQLFLIPKVPKNK